VGLLHIDWELKVLTHLFNSKRNNSPTEQK